jgi:hypothetical protein
VVRATDESFASANPGVNAISYNLPGFLFHLLAAYYTYRIARLFYGREAAWLAVLVFVVGNCSSSWSQNFVAAWQLVRPRPEEQREMAQARGCLR